MIDNKKLFKKYSLKTWKQNKLQIFFSITAISIAVGVLISLKLILVLNNFYINNSPKSANDGDLNVALEDYTVSTEQLKGLDKLKGEGKIRYATTYEMENNFTNKEISNVVNVKFIDSEYSCINKKVGNYAGKLGKNKVLINRATADRFNLKKGDTIEINLRGFSSEEKKFLVEDIIKSTNRLDESILGVIILDKSNMEAKEGKNTEIRATNINVVVNKGYSLEEIHSELNSIFNNKVPINTYKEGNQGNKSITDLQSKAAEFIEILVIIITGIGISFTNLLLILKRKKDYIVLSIYGMKEEMLRDLILYETFIISIISIIIGTSLSFIITGFIERTTIKEAGIDSLIKMCAFPLISTILFIIAQTMIFAILPITISKEIKPNSILRQEVQKLSFNDNWASAIFKMIMFMSIAFSIYIGSLKHGLTYFGIVIALIIVLYTLAFLGTILIAKIRPEKDKFLLLALRNINRQKNKIAICVTSLVSTLILCGLIINLGQSVIPNISKQFVGEAGYSLSLSSDMDEENISSTEKVLSKEISNDKYIKTIKTTGKIKTIQGKSWEDFSKNNYVDSLSEGNGNPNNINIEALDLSKNMLKYTTIKGKWLNSKEVNKNYIVLGHNFSNLGIETGDEVTFDINGKSFKFTVWGICSHSNFRDNSMVYVDINTFNDAKLTKDSKIEYLIKCDKNQEKELTQSLTKELKNSLVINERDLFNELGKFLRKLSYVFIYICIISVFSAVCLIGNILMIINYERITEFLILKVVGAKDRHIRRITFIEGVIIGGISGIIGILICEYLSNLVISDLFSQSLQYKYSFNPKIDLLMIFAAMILTIASSLIVINNIKFEKYSELLRAD